MLQIVHLKRFNYVGNKWVKSQKVVNFPFKDFDPTPYLASVPQETILRHLELNELEKKNLCNVDCSEEINEFDQESINGPIENGIDHNHVNDNDNENEEDNDDDEVVEQQNGVQIDSNGLQNTVILETELSNCKSIKTKRNSQLNMSGNSSSNASSCYKRVKPVGRRKRLVSTSLTRTPVVDDELSDYHEHHLKKDEDRFDLKYHLYAVVSHSGLLNGGHYVAYANNPNESWYCYNDSSCRDVGKTVPNIDPSTAYLLFYERQGLDYVPYLPKIDGKQIPSVLEQEVDGDNDLKKMCVIS